MAGLTLEVIDRICVAAGNSNPIEAIKELRSYHPLGLREARDFIERHRGNVNGLRQALLDVANLREGTVFESSVMRIEIKTADASFPEVQRFLVQVLETLYPSLSFEELQDFCLRAVSRLHGRPTVEQLQSLSESLFDKFYPELRDEDEREA